MFSMFERMNESVMQFPSGIAPQSHAHFHVTVHLRMHLYINVATRPRAQVRVCGLWLVVRVNVQGLWSVVGSLRPLVHTHKFRSVVCGRQSVYVCCCRCYLFGCCDVAIATGYSMGVIAFKMRAHTFSTCWPAMHACTIPTPTGNMHCDPSMQALGETTGKTHRAPSLH
jgi:hypothetical protein